MRIFPLNKGGAVKNCSGRSMSGGSVLRTDSTTSVTAWGQQRETGTQHFSELQWEARSAGGCQFTPFRTQQPPEGFATAVASPSFSLL
jgi:hypothetical protein